MGLATIAVHGVAGKAWVPSTVSNPSAEVCGADSKLSRQLGVTLPKSGATVRFISPNDATHVIQLYNLAVYAVCTSSPVFQRDPCTYHTTCGVPR